MGQIKLDAPKGSTVYLDGALAGSAEKLRSMWLEPGIYELQGYGVKTAMSIARRYMCSAAKLSVSERP
jgi:hypothetical protein